LKARLRASAPEVDVELAHFDRGGEIEPIDGSTRLPFMGAFLETEHGHGVALDLWHPMRPGQERRSFTAAEARAIAAELVRAAELVAGLAPAAGDGPAETPLRGADGSALKITLGSWKKAAGTVSFSCVDNQERATSRLTGLLSGASYSVFVVHLDVQGAGRFTPWGDAEGTTNNFTADSSGTASVTNTVPGCRTNRAAAVIIWHSDGMTHGPKPGTLGVTWHNSLITALP